MGFHDREWHREEVRRKTGLKDSFSANASSSDNGKGMSVNDWLAAQLPTHRENADCDKAL